MNLNNGIVHCAMDTTPMLALFPDNTPTLFMSISTRLSYTAPPLLFLTPSTCRTPAQAPHHPAALAVVQPPSTLTLSSTRPGNRDRKHARNQQQRTGRQRRCLPTRQSKFSHIFLSFLPTRTRRTSVQRLREDNKAAANPAPLTRYFHFVFHPYTSPTVHPQNRT